MVRVIMRLADWVVRRYGIPYLTGWHTKVGALATTLLAVNSFLIVVVEALMLAQQDQYSAAVVHLWTSPHTQAFLMIIGGNKIALGVANKFEKSVTGELQADVTLVEASLPAKDRAVVAIKEAKAETKIVKAEEDK